MTSLYKATLPTNPEFEEYILISGSDVSTYLTLEDIPSDAYTNKTKVPAMLNAPDKYKLTYIQIFITIENAHVQLLAEAKSASTLLQDNPELFI
jgi:hypothetical protein